MSYNTTTSAKAIVGQDVSTELLNEARALIDTYSDYRWESTEVTETLSGGGASGWLELFAPIIAVSSFTIDDVSQTEDTDFEVRKIEGVVRCFSGLPWGHDNIVITYTYGWTSADRFYGSTFPIVKGAEARIALYLKKNPLMLEKLGVEGLTVAFDDNHLQKLLCTVPRPAINFTALGPDTLNNPPIESLI